MWDFDQTQTFVEFKNDTIRILVELIKMALSKLYCSRKRKLLYLIVPFLYSKMYLSLKIFYNLCTTIYRRINNDVPRYYLK